MKSIVPAWRRSFLGRHELPARPRRGVGVLAAAIALAAALATSPARAENGTKVKLAIASPTFTYASTLVASALGYFEEEGLDVEFVFSGSGGKSLAAIAGGDVQVLNGSPTSMLRARDKGIDLVIVGATMTQFASHVVATGAWAKQHGITGQSDYKAKLAVLKGARAAISSPGSATDIELRFLAREAGLDPERDLTIQGMTQTVMLAALERERVDIGTLTSPYAEAAIRQFGAVMVYNTARGEIPALDGIFYNSIIVKRDYLAASPEVVRRVLRAQQKALDAIHDPARTAATRDKVHAAFQSKIDKAVFDDAWENNRPAYPKSIMIDKAMIERVGKFMAEMERNPVDPAILPKAWIDVPAREALASLGR